MTLVWFLAACGGSEQDNHQFANGPRPTDMPSSATLGGATDTAIARPPTPTPPPTLPAAEMLTQPAAPALLYTLVAGNVVAIEPSAGQLRTIWRAEREKALALAPSPAADAVAILTRATDKAEATYSVTVIGADGTVRRRYDDVAASLGKVKADGDGRDLIVWSPAGDRIAVFVRSGGGVLIERDGPATELVARAKAAVPVAAGWSPAGDAIAFAAASDASSPASLWIASLRGLPIDPVRVGDLAGEQRTVAGLVWAPDGSGVYFIQRRPDGPMKVGGDVFFAARAGSDGRLVVSATRVAPVAAIVAVRPSPDGRSLAYAAVSPDSGGGLDVSIWVQQIGTANAVRLPVASNAPVADLGWTSRGLVVLLEKKTDVSVLVAEPDTTLTTVAHGDIAPAATPSASPVVSPIASPIGSPTTGATPTGG